MLFSELVGIGLGIGNAASGDLSSGDGSWGDYLLLPELSCVTHSPSRNQRLSLALVPMDDASWERWVRFFERSPTSPALNNGGCPTSAGRTTAMDGSIGSMRPVSGANATRRRRSSLWITPDDIFPDSADSRSVASVVEDIPPPLSSPPAASASASASSSTASGSSFALRLRAFVVDNQRSSSTVVTVLNTWHCSERKQQNATGSGDGSNHHTLLPEASRIQFASWQSMFGEPSVQMYNIMCIADTLHPSLQERSAIWLQTVANPRIPTVSVSEVRLVEVIGSRRGSSSSFPACVVTIGRGLFAGECVLIKRWEKTAGSAELARADITGSDLRGLRPICLAVEPSVIVLAVQDDDEAFAALSSSLASMTAVDGHLKAAAASPRPTDGGASSQGNSSAAGDDDDSNDGSMDLHKPTAIYDIHVPYACANYSAEGVVVKYNLFVTLEDGRRWCVGKRYSELEAFHREIRELYLKDKDIGSRLSMFVGSGSAAPFPKFPAKSMTRGTSFELKYILRRRRHLSVYFAELMRDHGKTFFRNSESMQKLVRLCSPAHDSLYQPDYNLKDQDGFMQVVEKVYVNAYFVAPDYIAEHCTDKELLWAALKKLETLPLKKQQQKELKSSPTTVTPRAIVRSQSTSAIAADGVAQPATPPNHHRRSSSSSRMKLAEQSPEFGRCSFSSAMLLHGQDAASAESICGLIPTFAIALPYARIMYDPNSLTRMMIHLRCEKSEQRNEIIRRRDEIAGFYEYISLSKNNQIPDTAEARRFFSTFRRDNPPRLCVPYGDVRNGSCTEDEVEEQVLLLDSVQATSAKPPGATLQMIFAHANEEGLARYPGGAPVVTLAAISQRLKYLETGVCKNSTHEEKKMRQKEEGSESHGTGGLPQERAGPATIEIAEAADLTWQAPQKCSCSETTLCPPKDNTFETRYSLASGHVIVVHCPKKGQHRRRIGATSREMKRD